MRRMLYCYYRLLKDWSKSFFELVRGVWKIAHLRTPIVTIFGGSRVGPHMFYAQQAHNFVHRLAEAHISIITGGGAGIMEAAMCAMSEERSEKISEYSLGVMVKGLKKMLVGSKCIPNYIVMNYLFSRKWLMTKFSCAFVLFPGGFGTANELTEVLTLMETKLISGCCIILIDKRYWQPFLDWCTHSALKYGLIEPDAMDLLHVADNLDDALNLIFKQCLKKD